VVLEEFHEHLLEWIKKVKNLLKSIYLSFQLCIGLAIMALANSAFAQTTVTAFAPSTNTTSGVWFENDVRPGATASVSDLTGISGDLETNQPLPIGAAKLTTDFTNEAKAEVGVADAYGQAGSVLTSLQVAYSWHKAANVGQNPNAAPSIKLSFFNPSCIDATNNPGLDCFGALVYEPYQNGFGNNPALDTWNTSALDYNTGMWWWTGGFGSPNQGGGPADKTLAEWHLLLSGLSSDFASADLVLVSIGVGSYNQGQVGYVDDVTISHTFGSGYSASYDFEPPPEFETLGECISTLIADNCTGLTGKARATCNHEQQLACFDLFDVK
jgi:hypothetical protein